MKYPEREIQDLGRGLTRYANRLGLAPCMEPEEDPEAAADPQE